MQSDRKMEVKIKGRKKRNNKGREREKVMEKKGKNIMME